MFAFELPYLIDMPGPRKEFLSILMKRDRHDAIGQIESFLNPIPMMHIDIQIEDPWVDLQQFKDTNDDIVDIAEPASL